MSESETKTRQAKMSEWAQEWILEKLLRKVVLEFKEQVFMERYIMKKPLYKKFSWWFRFSREDTRKALKMLAEAYEGVKFGNRGLLVPREYLETVTTVASS